MGVFFLIIVALVMSVFFAWWELYQSWLYGNIVEYSGFFWVELGNEVYSFWNFRFDFFSNLISFVILSAALVVSLFVFFDMWDDKDGVNFIINLGFFISFMLILVNAGNLLLFYFGWEGIGLTSLFLVNYWSERVRSVKATIKVFIINKVGDFFFLLLICSFIFICGDFDFDVLNALSPFYANIFLKFFSIKVYLVEVLGILLFFSACVKSAQFGFHIWLLEAMEAPLGASALMHSSTLVIAGLVLIFKLPSIVEFSYMAKALMFIFGILSATYGSFIAIFQFELKVIMAYSTISNMGYMFTLFSLGAYKETVLIMVFHAYIKIYMFLIVGGIMLHCNGCQDVRWMGGLMPYIPALWVSYVVGSFGLAGLPFLSGYYYKAVIWQSMFDFNVVLSGGEFLIFLSFIFTLIYLFRTGYLIFAGPKNGHRSIYRKRYFPSLFILNLFFLSFILMFSSTFIHCMIDGNLSNILFSFCTQCELYVHWLLYNLSEYALYVGVLTYFFAFLFFVLWYIFSLNFSWNFLKNWFFFLHFSMLLYFILIFSF